MSSDETPTVESREYTKIIFWSAEDNCYIGMCPDLFFGGCHGENENTVYKELTAVINDFIASAKDQGETLPVPTYSLKNLALGRRS